MRKSKIRSMDVRIECVLFEVALVATRSGVALGARFALELCDFSMSHVPAQEMIFRFNGIGRAVANHALIGSR